MRREYTIFFYFCPRNIAFMPQKKKNTPQVISLDAFGSAKNYWLCWIQSPLPPFSFANKVQKELRHPCAYIGGISLPDIHPDLSFPMYYMSFNLEYDINLVILANHVTAPMAMSLAQENPLFGGLLFEDDYYLFNNQGLTKMQFSFPQADYLLLLSADKQVDLEDYIKMIPTLSGIKLLCADTPQNVAASQKKSKQVLDFLQYLYYESESFVNDYLRKKLFRKLHHKMSVSAANYEAIRFPIEDNRMITSSLLRRKEY